MASFELRSRDLAVAREAMEIALNPRQFSSVDAWGEELLGSLKKLTGADRGSFLVRRGEEQRWAVVDYPVRALREYGIRIESVVPDVDIWKRLIRLGVHHRDELWLPIVPGFYRTAYYNDFLRPIRAFDSLGFTWRPFGEPAPEVCQLLVHHDRERGPRFGARERMLLSLLQPSIVAGSRLALAGADPGSLSGPSATSHPYLVAAASAFGLTPRQAEVAALMARRLSHGEIAQRLGISPHTARRHEEAVRRRLGVRSRNQVASRLQAGSPQEG